MSIALIATVYIGFAVADGRPAVIAVETTVAGAFVLLARHDCRTHEFDITRQRPSATHRSVPHEDPLTKTVAG